MAAAAAAAMHGQRYVKTSLNRPVRRLLYSIVCMVSISYVMCVVCSSILGFSIMVTVLNSALYN